MVGGRLGDTDSIVNMVSLLMKILFLLVPCVGFISCQPTAEQCSNLITTLQLDPSVKILLTEPLPDNYTFQDPYSLAYPQPAPNLPAFCRVYCNITTSPSSATLFEVWMPLNTWNGRFMFVGNGGGAGGVNYPAMGAALRANFSTVSTDGGHNSSSTDGSWQALGPEVAIDFGYRALQLSSIYGKSITSQFYEQNSTYSYYSGCSSGGKQGMKFFQMYPEMFDGYSSLI